MGRRRRSSELVVAMNGSKVGVLRRAPGVLEFQYAATWLATDLAPPISLSLPLSPDPYSGDGVRGFFDNLLPDNDAIRSRIRRLGAESTHPFDLLAVVGHDCVGALQFCPSEDLPDVRCVVARPVSDSEIARRLGDSASHPLGMAIDEDFRISIAGAHEKTALLWYRDGWHLPGGATPTTHILKPPIGPVQSGIDLSQSVENEWLCSRIVAAFGLRVSNTEIGEFDGTKALVVERFDRRWSKDGSWLVRLPQEDVCQSLGVPPERKYESDGGPSIRSTLDLLLQSSDPEEDRRMFFRALIVYWLLAAIDGHGKNFSIFLDAGGRCRLTPLYDILSAHPMVARKELAAQNIKMAMAVTGKNRHYRWQDIQGRHWVSTARASLFSEVEAKELVDECRARAPEVVDGVAADLPDGFPEDVARPILEGVLATAARK